MWIWIFIYSFIYVEIRIGVFIGIYGNCCFVWYKGVIYFIICFVFIVYFWYIYGIDVRVWKDIFVVSEIFFGEKSNVICYYFCNILSISIFVYIN